MWGWLATSHPGIIIQDAWKTYCKSISFLLKENENMFLRFELGWFVCCWFGYFLLTSCVSVLQLLVIWTLVIYLFLTEKNLYSTPLCVKRTVFQDLCCLWSKRTIYARQVLDQSLWQDWALEITGEVALRGMNKPAFKCYICIENEKLSNSSMCVVANL